MLFAMPKFKRATKLFQWLILLTLVCVNFPVVSQKIKLGFRGGASFANFVNHNYSGHQSIRVVPTSSVSIVPLPSPSSSTYIFTNPQYETNFIQDVRTGFFSELYLNSALNDTWILETGLGYAQRGIDLNYSSSSRTVDSESITVANNQFKSNLRINYITLPVLCKYYLDTKQRFYIAGGIYGALAMPFRYSAIHRTTSITTSIFSSSTSQFISETYPTKMYVHRLDVGLVGGLGSEFPLKNNWSIGFDIRINSGLTRVPAKYEEYGFSFFSPNTRNLTIETGVKIFYALIKK
jgi:hypothetical protein